MTASRQHAAGSRAQLSLWLFDCDAHADQLLQLDASAKVLTAAEHARALRLHDDIARRRWLCARIALRRALGFHIGAAFERGVFEITPQGRPYLAHPAPHFSLSHAGPHALIAVHAGAAVGCDLEHIARRKIAPERQQRLEAFAQSICGHALPTLADVRFIQAWCRIEAAAKAEGCGVGRLLTREGLMGPAKPGHEPQSAPQPLTDVRAADLDVAHLAPGFAAAIAGPASVIDGCAPLSVAGGAGLLDL